MAIKIWDEHGRPPIGARVYVKEGHFIGTVVSLSFQSKHFDVEPDCGGTGTSRAVIQQCCKEVVQVIGPPELVGNCMVDTCPICEEDIRIRKGEE